MKKKYYNRDMKNYIGLILIVLISFGVVVYANDDIVWKKVAENNYINPDGIIQLSDRYGFSFLLKAYNKGQYEPVNGNFIDYTMSQYSIDCADLTYKIGIIDSYGRDNNFVNGDYNRHAKYQPLVQGTAVWNVAKELCRF